MYGTLELPLSPIFSLQWDVKENLQNFVQNGYQTSKWEKKKSVKLYCREKYDLEIIKAEGCVVWIPSLLFLIERYKSYQFMKFLKEVFIRQSLSLCIFRTKTPTHKNLPLFWMVGEGNIFRKIRQPHIIEWRCGVKSWSSKWVL